MPQKVIYYYYYYYYGKISIILLNNGALNWSNFLSVLKINKLINVLMFD